MPIAIANIKNPEAAIICILALILKMAIIKQASVEHSIPKKKKYNSTISFGVKTLIKIKVIMTQLMSNGIKRYILLFV